MDIWIEDTSVNRANLRKAFNEAVVSDYFMMDNLQFVPGWTDLMLNNHLKLDILVDMKGLEG